MDKFVQHKGIIAPLDRVNVDTDAIIPKQFLKKIDRAGFGKHLFHEWRFTDYDGTQENADFVLNQEPYRQASVLLTRDNFGSGSSREHAPWALTDYGIRVIIAPSFADIFYNNSIKNGLLLIPLKSEDVEALFQYTDKNPGCSAVSDLEHQTLTVDGLAFKFEINAFAKHCLLNGLDQIGWTLQFEDEIQNYEKSLVDSHPWLS